MSYKKETKGIYKKQNKWYNRKKQKGEKKNGRINGDVRVHRRYKTEK